jgi:hypothetical protein
MKPTEKSAIVKVEIPNRELARFVLDQWSSQAGISLSIRRGRVTSERVSYELEIRGGATGVARIVRQSGPWNASRRFLNPVLSGALA